MTRNMVIEGTKAAVRYPAGRRAVVAWCVFDWANSAFPTVIQTFLFGAYFTTAVAPNAEIGTAEWGQANTVAAVIIALISPILGAIADQGGRRKPWLLALNLICIAAMAALWFVRPDPDDAMFGLVAMVIGTLGFELGTTFYNAMLTDVVHPDYLGRVSGWGWGAGYAGGLACLLLSWFLFVWPQPALFGLDRAANEHVRIVSPLAALWFAVFAVPLFIFVPDRRSKGYDVATAIRRGVAGLGKTLRSVRQHANVARFLLAKMIYIDGLNTLFTFGGIYAAGTFGMTLDQVLVFGILLNVCAGLGAVTFAWIDDWLGAKPTIAISLVALMLLGGAILFIDDRTWFYVAALAIGVFVGPAQAASRSMMARLAPPDQQTEFFGLYALAGKATAFAGPAVVGWTTYLANSQRAGMATILPFLVVGVFLLFTVKEPRNPSAGRLDAPIHAE